MTGEWMFLLCHDTSFQPSKWLIDWIRYLVYTQTINKTDFLPLMLNENSEIEKYNFTANLYGEFDATIKK